MKRTLLLLCVLLLGLALPATAKGAAFAIILKNGQRLVTNYYWEEKGQLFFNYAGGQVGIDPRIVQSIGESSLTHQNSTNPQPAPEQIKPEGVSPPEESGASDSAAGKSDAIAPDQESKEISELRKVEQAAKERLENLGKTGTMADRNEARKEWLELNFKLHKLTRP